MYSFLYLQLTNKTEIYRRCISTIARMYTKNYLYDNQDKILKYYRDV